MIKTEKVKKTLTKIPDREYISECQNGLFPLLSEEAIEADALYEAFWTNPQDNMDRYSGQRIRVKGIASFVGIDIHGLASVQLSDSSNGENMVLCVFNQNDILAQAKEGEAVTIEGNYLLYHEEFAIVLKNSKLII